MASSSDVIPSDLQVCGTKTPELQKAFNLLKTHASIVANFTLHWQDLEDHCNCIQKSIENKLEILQKKSHADGNALLPNIGLPALVTHRSPPLQSEVVPEKTNAPSVDEPIQSKLVSFHGEGDALSSKIDGPALSPETHVSPGSEDEEDPEEIDAPCDETDSVPGDESNVKQDGVHTISIQNQEVKSDKPQVKSKESHGKEENKNSEQAVFDSIPMQDGKTLLIYLIEKSKFHESIRTHICNALKASADPVKLVLEAIKWFFPVNKKEMNYEDRDVKRSCVLLLEEMENAGPTIKTQEIEEAKALALDWKVKMQAGIENSLQISGFLHLLSAFGLAANFDADEIFRLCYVCLQRRQAPQLLRSLGLTHRVPEFIKQLISQKKQTEAVRFIYEFDLVKEFPLVPLLKMYYENAKRATKDIKRGQASQRDLDQARGKEIIALKAIVTCIEKYKLEAEYSPNALKNQIEQLKKLKNDSNAKATNMGPKNELRESGKKRPSSSSAVDLRNKRRNNHLPISYKEAARNTTVYDASPVYSNQPFYHQPIGFLPDRDQVLISSARNSVPASNSYYATHRVAPLHSSSAVSDHSALDFTTSARQMISSPGAYISPTSAARNMSLTGRYYGSSGPVSQHVGLSARSYQLSVSAENTAHNSQSVVAPYGVNIANGSSGVTLNNGLASNVTITYSSIPEEPSRTRNYNAGGAAAYRSGYGGPSKPKSSIYHL